MPSEMLKIFRASHFASLLGLLLFQPAFTDEIRFDSVRAWAAWSLPHGLVEATPDGRLQPVAIRRNIDAVANIALFGGGIHEAGSKASQAALVVDGDLTTGWAPNPQDPPDTWFLDLDLGRGVFATHIVLHFAADAPPFSLVDLLLSTGEPQIDESNTSFNDVLVFRTQHRFKENDSHRVVFELDQLLPGCRLEPVEQYLQRSGHRLSLALAAPLLRARLTFEIG